MTEHDALAGWYVDAEGWLRSPAGAKLGRIANGALWVWCKRARAEVRLTAAELARLIAEAKERKAA